MKVKKTARRFEIIEFTDIYGEKCSLQQSSFAKYKKPGSSAIWLGCDNAKNDSVSGEPISPRMHLDRKLVKALILHLSKWCESGSFK